MSKAPTNNELEKKQDEDTAAENALMKPILAQIKMAKASAFPALRRAGARLEKRLLPPAKRSRQPAA